jgi:ubiquinol-cytochrome c reductase cytochrome c1 subunit
MTKSISKLAKRFALGLALIATPALAIAATGPHLEHSGANLKDRASLQRGAALFVNYCSGCHSLGLQRYSRMAEDLGLTEEQVMKNLVFTDAKFGGPMKSALTAKEGEKWFGKAPPDLSLVARAKLGGADWTYTFLKSFYADESRPSGWNNTVLAGASMPNVLWELQGTQRPILGPDGNVERLELATPGSQTPEEFDATVRDITNFLTYVSEPSAIKRQSIGVWVILFLTVFTLLAWMLKKEFWRDVH